MTRFEVQLIPVRRTKAGEYEGSEKKAFWRTIDDTTVMQVLRPKDGGGYEDYLDPCTYLTLPINGIVVERNELNVIRLYRVNDMRDLQEAAGEAE